MTHLEKKQKVINLFYSFRYKIRFNEQMQLLMDATAKMNTYASIFQKQRGIITTSVILKKSRIN